MEMSILIVCGIIFIISGLLYCMCMRCSHNSDTSRNSTRHIMPKTIVYSLTSNKDHAGNV